MNNSCELFYVEEGNALLVSNDAQKYNALADWKNSILVVAEDEKQALDLANLWDKGEIQEDNVFWPDCYGIPVVALET